MHCRRHLSTTSNLYSFPIKRGKSYIICRNYPVKRNNTLISFWLAVTLAHPPVTPPLPLFHHCRLLEVNGHPILAGISSGTNSSSSSGGSGSAVGRLLADGGSPLRLLTVRCRPPSLGRRGGPAAAAAALRQQLAQLGGRLQQKTQLNKALRAETRRCADETVACRAENQRLLRRVRQLEMRVRLNGGVKMNRECCLGVGCRVFRGARIVGPRSNARCVGSSPIAARSRGPIHHRRAGVSPIGDMMYNIYGCDAWV